MFNGLLSFSFKEVAVGVLLSAVLIGGGVAAIVTFVPRSAGGEVAPPTQPPPSEVVTPIEPYVVTIPPAAASMVITSLTLHQSEGGAVVADCGNECSAPSGWETTLIAIPAVGYEFVRWGCLSTSCHSYFKDRTAQISLNNIVDDIAVRPVFRALTRLEINQSEGGTAVADCGTDCLASPGWHTTVTAIPDEGYKFTRWQCSGLSCPRAIYGVDEIDLHIEHDVVLSPVFDIVVGIIIDNPEVGGIAGSYCEPSCLTTLSSFRPVIRQSIFTYPNNNYVFSHWECELEISNESCVALNYELDEYGDRDYSYDIPPAKVESQTSLVVAFSSDEGQHYNKGVIRIKPIFTESPGTLHEINLPNEFEARPQSFNYAVLNLTSKTASHNTELYNRIAGYSIDSWASLNPSLSFNKVKTDDPSLNLQIVYLDDKVLDEDGLIGVYCSFACYGYHATYNLTKTPTVFINGTVNSPGSFTDETAKRCMEENRLVGLPTTVTNITMHELGHAFGLDNHHFFALNLLSGSPKGKIPFDYKGLVIPDIAQFERTGGYYLCGDLISDAHSHPHP